MLIPNGHPAIGFTRIFNNINTLINNKYVIKKCIYVDFKKFIRTKLFKKNLLSSECYKS